MTTNNDIAPTADKIAQNLKRHDTILNIFDNLIDALEEKNKGDNRWFIFISKIGKKFLTQALTLQNIFSQDIYFEKKGGKNRFIDFGSTYSLLRVQLETYAVFYHLFGDKCSIDEKSVRFNLWHLDSLQQRQNYLKPDDENVLAQLNSELEEINIIIDRIKSNAYFKTLPTDTQNYLIKKSLWKFSSTSIKNPEKGKWKLSMDKMVENMGLKETHFGNWYAYTSTHTHTSFWSVIQNDTLTLEQKITTEYVAIEQATFLMCFFLHDLSRVQKTGTDFFNSLSQTDQDIIKSFDIRGRKHE
jgi:hypothetical protein